VQIALNLGRVLIAVAWTSLVGMPLVMVIYTTYRLGRLASLCGRDDILTRILGWNARATGVVAQSWWAPMLLRISGVTTWRHETQAIDWQRSYVVCSNHASIFDILALVRALPMPIRFVAKRELLKWPVIGWSLRPSGQIVVDRQRREAAVHSIEEASRHNIGGQVIFFVEGTRTRTGELMPFKRGAFHFAVRNRMPVLPVAVVGSFNALARLPWWRLHPGRKIGVVFGAAIDPPSAQPGDSSPQVDALLQATRTRMELLLQEFHESDEPVV